MKKLLTVLAVSLMLVPVTFAQGTVDVSAAVVEALTWSNSSPASFGEVQTNSTVTLAPDNGSTENVVGGTAQVGSITLSGSSDNVVLIGIESDNLTGPGTSVLTYTPNVTGSAAGDQSSSQPVSGNITLDSENGTYVFYVGGELDVPADADAGAYSGTVTLTASYVGS